MLRNKESGYTLVEIIVSLGIFLTIATIATGALVSVLRAQKSTYASQSTAEQLRYFQDIFSRDIRESVQVSCDADSITLQNDGNAGAVATDIVYAFVSDGEGGIVLNKDGSRMVQLPIESHTIVCLPNSTTPNAPRLVTLLMKFEDTERWYEVTVGPRFASGGGQ